MQKTWLIGLFLLAFLLLGPIKLFYQALFLLLPIYFSFLLIQRDDLSTFQLLALFFLTWFVPVAGPIAVHLILKNVLPQRQTE